MPIELLQLIVEVVGDSHAAAIEIYSCTVLNILMNYDYKISHIITNYNIVIYFGA